MAKKTAIDKLNEAVSDILSEYEDDIADNLAEITIEMGKKGTKALKQKSREALNSQSGDYAKGWKYQVDRGRLNTTVTIYNDHPGLAHLLEHGHVIRNGTRRTYGHTPAHEHIVPVEKELVETFEEEVLSKL